MLNKYLKLIVPMIETTHEAIDFLVEHPNIDNAGIIGDISGVIRSISNSIEANAEPGEAAEAIAACKKLPEAIQTCNQRKGTPRLYKAFRDFVNAIQAIPVKYKVLFLPNYDNTWDALESVYFAFSADPRFETEIVITPIYRNTPTGQKHIYTDMLTPMGIPNTRYDAYDIKKDLPDIVFYTNPYDALSHPKYMSFSMKSYTGLMVYVPYYTFHNSAPLTEEQIKKGIETQTELSGHDNADIIIAPGKSFMNLFGNKSKNADKMVLLGSPKTDYLINHKKNNDWPRRPDWEERIKDKKVFMLNTHFRDINEEIFYKWMEFLTDKVIEDTDIALIWRPHPQTFLMLDALSKEFYEAYKDVIGKIENCRRIIIDQTPSSVSAFMYSDAVLSPSSSTLSLAACLELPVFCMMANPKKDPNNPKWIYRKPEYDQIIEAANNYDVNELTNFDVFPSFGFSSYLKPEEYDILRLRKRYWLDPMDNFITSVKNGDDLKSDLRKKYRLQLFNNCDGTCAQHILAYVAHRAMSAV